jgi:hypothetical protein
MPVLPSVRVKQLDCHCYISVFFESLLRNFKIHYNPRSITGTLRGYLFLLLISYLWILLRMRNNLDKCCRENQNTFYVQFFFFRKFCSLWNNVHKCRRVGQATNENMAHVHCMLELHQQIHTKFLLFIDFPLKKLLRQHVPMVRYKSCYFSWNFRAS